MAKWWSALTTRERPVSRPESARHAARHRFTGVVGSDYATWSALVGGTASAGRVSRAEAIRVPAVKRARDLIAGVIGTLPIHAVREATGERIDHSLLAQPEALAGLPRSVTMARTVEDTMFDGSALWLVVLRTAEGFPSVVQRVDHGKWTQDEDGTIRVNGQERQPEDVIIFTSTCEPLLTAGAPAIRNLLRLEATAAMYAETPEAAEYFTPADGIDPAEDEDVQTFLDDWERARRARKTAYVPASVALNQVKRMTAEELQLISAREFAVSEVARMTGIDPAWLGLNITTRQYSNLVDERRSYVDFTLSTYLRPIEERLSLGDVTPRGQRVLFNLDGFLRASTVDRYNAHKTALDAGFLTVDEVRELENRPPMGDANVDD